MSNYGMGEVYKVQREYMCKGTVEGHKQKKINSG